MCKYYVVVNWIQLYYLLTNCIKILSLIRYHNLIDPTTCKKYSHFHVSFLTNYGIQQIFLKEFHYINFTKRKYTLLLLIKIELNK